MPVFLDTEKEKNSLSEEMLHYLMAVEQQKEQEISKPRLSYSVFFFKSHSVSRITQNEGICNAIIILNKILLSN